MNDWKNKIIYQIYPRSFLDTSGNGVGDLMELQIKLITLSTIGLKEMKIFQLFLKVTAEAAFLCIYYLKAMELMP